jgi:hypothetical protein
MAYQLHDIRSADGMKVTNTQLAAALVALGHEILPSTNFAAEDVIFDFEDDPGVIRAEETWKSYMAGAARGANDPLATMFEVSRARQWILDQVIHGSHNQGSEIPQEHIATTDFHMTVCLVSMDCYLIKLDKGSRTFYFTPGAAVWKKRYNNPEEGSRFYWARLYLRTLDQLVRRINSRNLARQNLVTH